MTFEEAFKDEIAKNAGVVRGLKNVATKAKSAGRKVVGFFNEDTGGLGSSRLDRITKALADTARSFTEGSPFRSSRSWIKNRGA